MDFLADLVPLLPTETPFPSTDLPKHCSERTENSLNPSVSTANVLGFSHLASPLAVSEASEKSAVFQAPAPSTQQPKPSGSPDICSMKPATSGFHSQKPAFPLQMTAQTQTAPGIDQEPEPSYAPMTPVPPQVPPETPKIPPLDAVRAAIATRRTVSVPGDFGEPNMGKTRHGNDAILHHLKDRPDLTYIFTIKKKGKAKSSWKCSGCHTLKTHNHLLPAVPLISIHSGRLVHDPEHPPHPHFCNPKQTKDVIAQQVYTDIREEVRRTGKRPRAAFEESLAGISGLDPVADSMPDYKTVRTSLYRAYKQNREEKSKKLEMEQFWTNLFVANSGIVPQMDRGNLANPDYNPSTSASGTVDINVYDEIPLD